MNNMLTDHPSKDVRSALIRLLDALCMWERTTSRHHVLIVKDSIGCEYRTLDSCPPPDHIGDHTLLESFEQLAEQEAK